MISLKFSNDSMRMLEVSRMQAQDKKFVCEQKCLIITKQEQLFRKKGCGMRYNIETWDQFKKCQNSQWQKYFIIGGPHLYIGLFDVYEKKRRDKLTVNSLKRRKLYFLCEPDFQRGWAIMADPANSKVSLFGHTIPSIFFGPIQLMEVP